MTARLAAPASPYDWDTLRTMCWEYRDFLMTQPPKDRAAVLNAYPEPVYRQIVDALEDKHTAPNGTAVIAWDGDTVLGCGMAQMLSATDIEFKRIYIRAEARGVGLGRRIVEALMAAARDLGAKRVLMDTGRVLTDAQALYDKMGFRRRGPYHDAPEEIAELLVFYEMDL